MKEFLGEDLVNKLGSTLISYSFFFSPRVILPLSKENEHVCAWINEDILKLRLTPPKRVQVVQGAEVGGVQNIMH